MVGVTVTGLSGSKPPTISTLVPNEWVLVTLRNPTVWGRGGGHPRGHDPSTEEGVRRGVSLEAEIPLVLELVRCGL